MNQEITKRILSSIIIVAIALFFIIKGSFFYIFFLSVFFFITSFEWFKMTKNKSGEGKRIFLMAPLHHHYQKKGIHETKIVARFWMIGILLAILTLATLKLR